MIPQDIVTGHLVGRQGAGQPLLMRGEFLHAFLVTERVRSHLPVQVNQGGSSLQAAAMDYDNATRRLELKGPIRAVLAPRVQQVPR